VKIASSSTLHPDSYGGGTFLTTRWTMVLDASREGPSRAEAMEQFARTYWYPVYAFIRRRGSDAEEAEDLTQGFFCEMLEKDWLAGVERRESRFSTLLLTILRRYLVECHRHETRRKRGGGRAVISLDMAQAEDWLGVEPFTDETPEAIFERRFALSVMGAALESLKEHLHSTGRGRLADTLSPFLSREPSPGEYQTASEALGISPNGVAAAVRRLRLEARDFLRAEVAAGLTDRGRIDEEMQHIAAALRGAR
jgi:DNA-directed RNA polymerase specialized sigma24 family protein